ncbi:sarcoplasmic calcium-binding protein 1 [Teleopsis dalmanni]|uniref:sarcoplasmic calcium-binding protein 1 n=1 Tax=Teleopsis dalmanni TaxID=139649 RepID=UPI0018CD1798|nr:sarcoplasmic calcium-binding protein 1 [Teleopsis dalmanni]XP_037958303.1 sarcoplasmic calcium-binding protein 1 [Teleopsis dalmanni]
MSYSWDNRVDFVVRYMYDIDNNGYLDQNDFQCMAVRACVVEGKGDCSTGRLDEYRKLMKNLWDEISEIADDDKDGKISNKEFKDAVKKTCVGKKYDDFPQAMRAFIEANFKVLDINNDGIVGIEEYRYNCISRIAIDDITPVDKSFDAMLNDDDKKKGGLSLDRYKELYAQFLGNTAENHPAVNLFGPL